MNAALLAAIPAFAELLPHEIDTLAAVMRIIEFPAGEAIVEQGERPRAMYIVLEGDIAVTRRLPDGVRYSVGSLHRHDIFGALSLLDGGVRAASCRAVGDVRVAELAADDFARLTHARTPISARFLLVVTRALIRELRSANQRLAELVEHAPVDRSAWLRSLPGWV